MAIWKGILRYTDISNGLGWTVVTYAGEALADDMKSRADTWNTAYMAVCPTNTHLIDMRVSDTDVKGDMRVFPASTFGQQTGSSSGNTVPLAECILAAGRSNLAATIGRAFWHLHGISAVILTSAGVLNQGHANVIALRTACASYLYQYRKKISSKFHWPIVTPPVAYGSYDLEGPYVRRLGNPFFSPGQRARYTRTPAAG